MTLPSNEVETPAEEQPRSEKRGTWVRLRSDWEWNPSKVELSAGATAALTVGVVYISLIFCFTLAFFLTVPRHLTQVYNVTVSNEDYRALVKVEIENTHEPLVVDMTCYPGGKDRTLYIFFDMNERLVIYKDIQKKACYVRSSSGEQFQEEARMFKALLLGTNTLPSDTKPTVHYLLLATTKSQRETLLASRQKNFCSSSKIYWMSFIVSEGSGQGPSEVDFLLKMKGKQQWSYHVTYMDTCLQTLVLHKSKNMFLL